MSFSLTAWIKSKPQRKLVTPVSVGKLRFIGEQDGPVERDLKVQWLPILTAAPQIRRAFLVRCSYDQGDQHVVLALCSTGGPDLGLVEAMRVPYARAFHRDCPLDMMFATAAQEALIENVCPPFYTVV
jgi:hypothetical protein